MKNSKIQNNDLYIVRRQKRLSNIHGRLPEQAMWLALGTNNHLERCELVFNRLVKARRLQDHASINFEADLASALLYEAADHCFMAISLLNPAALDIVMLAEPDEGPPIMGGQDSVATLEILVKLNSTAARIIELETNCGLSLDFTKPVDEKEGLSYLVNAHWQDCVPDSTEASFQVYFSLARKAVLSILDQTPSFWNNKYTVRQYLWYKNYLSLLHLVHRLDNAPLPNLW